MNIIVIIIIIIIIIVTVIIITDAAGNDRSKNRLTTATVVMFSLTTTKTSAFNEKSHFSLPITITDENYNENWKIQRMLYKAEQQKKQTDTCTVNWH